MESLFVTIIVLLLMVLYVLLSRLAMKNPFDRVLTKKRYTYREDFRDGPTLIIHKLKKNDYSLDILTDAVFDIMYNHHDLEKLRVITEERFPFGWELFVMFRFLRELNLRDYIVINDHDFHFFGFVERLVVPKVIQAIHFAEDCHELKQLYIPCNRIVPAYQENRKPIIVSEGFTIYVPETFFDAYKNDQTWSDLIFISKYGEVIQPRFKSAFKGQEAAV